MNPLHRWKYTGEPLEKAEDVFNDKIRIRHEMESYNDVKRLNDRELLEAGSKYCDILADKSKPRECLHIFLGDLKKVQVACGQLNELLFDAIDDVSNSEMFSEGMREIVSGFYKVQTNLILPTWRFAPASRYKLIGLTILATFMAIRIRLVFRSPLMFSLPLQLAKLYK